MDPDELALAQQLAEVRMAQAQVPEFNVQAGPEGRLPPSAYDVIQQLKEQGRIGGPRIRRTARSPKNIPVTYGCPQTIEGQSTPRKGYREL